MEHNTVGIEHNTVGIEHNTVGIEHNNGNNNVGTQDNNVEQKNVGEPKSVDSQRKRIPLLAQQTIVSPERAAASTSMMSSRYVFKRSGEMEEFSNDAIAKRVFALMEGLDPFLREQDEFNAFIHRIFQKVKSGMTTSEIDRRCAEVAIERVQRHPDYDKLAGRIMVSNNHKETPDTFSAAMKLAYENFNFETEQPCPLVSKPFYDFVCKHASVLDAAINHEHDSHLSQFAMTTLERAYLLRKVTGVNPITGTFDTRVIERFQYLLMRKAVGFNLPLGQVTDNTPGLSDADRKLFNFTDPTTEEEALKEILEDYQLMSDRMYTHATPTMQDAGRFEGQLASCFLLTLTKDSVAGIEETERRCAEISKYLGGIGLSVTKVRAKGSYIGGRAGKAAGLMRWLRVLNEKSLQISQGGDKRKGSFAVYCEPWHADIEDFIRAKNPENDESMRALDLFYGVWANDLFMKRVDKNEMWSLFCPNRVPGLADLWGEEFEKKYVEYEEKKKYKKRVRARDLYDMIFKSLIETGGPYLLYKDTCNRRSNQQHLGTILGSNLCTEIIEYCSPDEIAVCNLASIALPMFIYTDEYGNRQFDFERLAYVTRRVTLNLNKVILRTFYPLIECKRSNLRHRPIGIGVQGLADAFVLMRMPYESPEAQQLNKDIFQTIYYAALQASNQLCIKNPNNRHISFEGSPASKGILQFDMQLTPPGVVNELEEPDVKSNAVDQARSLTYSPNVNYDWDTLKQSIVKHGLANSLLIAPMPTATTSQIMGNSEFTEPYASNVFVRRTLAGEFVCFNRFLVQDLTDLGLWNNNMMNQLIAHGGSVQNIRGVPEEIRQLYKTVYEMDPKVLMQMAVDRGVFIDQSQSFNLYMDHDTKDTMEYLKFYAMQGWKKGLKTCIYYLRQTPAKKAHQVTVPLGILHQQAAPVPDQPVVHATNEMTNDLPVQEENDCERCSS